MKVLDHGYVEFVEAWGTGLDGRKNTKRDPSDTEDYEVGIIEAARQSTQGSFRGWEAAACDCVNSSFGYTHTPDDEIQHTKECASVVNKGDARLLSYLYNNQHSTPFEFSGMTIEVQAPIFVFREWHRHRTQSYNEASARYAPLPDLNYIPSVDRVMQSGGANKQAQGIMELDRRNAEHFVSVGLPYIYAEAERGYQASLEAGIPKELARLMLPVGRYSKMRATANLRNWLAFMTLRCDPRAQWEIQQYAQAVSKIVEEKFPQTWGLWVSGLMGEPG